MQFTIHPNVYNTDRRSKGLLHMLEQIWVRKPQIGEGKFYIIAGFANYNGGIRFFDVFRKHIEAGGECEVYLGGSTSQRLSSQQVVEELLKVGCKVYLINRKRILHAKCYGYCSGNDQALVISSGNFTGPGMSQNIEASLLLEEENISNSNFSWSDLTNSFFHQNWDIYIPSLDQTSDAPEWKLLYDEIGGVVQIADEQEITMLIQLGHSDTARIQANKGEKEGRGTQYFWLSKDSYDFFPALTIRNRRGFKATYSTIIRMSYIDLNIVDDNCRVTFEAENNLDFRLGTAKLRYTKIAEKDDLAAITRVGERDYELRIIKQGSSEYTNLKHYTINFIGHQGKKFGYLSNKEFYKIIK